MNREEFLAAYEGGRRDFSGEYFTGANLTNVNLRGADLTGANLIDANLTDAILAGADLTGANLIDANLSGALLAGVNISRAKLNRAEVEVFYAAGIRDFRFCDLRYVGLTGVNLTGADLTGARISGATLDRAGVEAFYAAGVRDFSDCMLEGVDLTGVNLTDTNLRGVGFTGAILKDVELSGAMLDIGGIDASHRSGNRSFSVCNLCWIDFSTVTLKNGIKGGSDRLSLESLAGELIEFDAKEVINDVENEVKVVRCAVKSSREGAGVVEDPPTDKQMWDLFMVVYEHFAPESTKAMSKQKLGFFDTLVATTAAVVMRCVPKKLLEDKDLSPSQRLLRLKHYADNDSQADSDTGKAWVAMGQVQLYGVSTLDGSFTWLLFPEKMRLSFRSDGVCDGFKVDGKQNPEEWKPVFDACMRQYNLCLDSGNQLPEGEPWHLEKAQDGSVTRVTGDLPPAPVADTERVPGHTDGGGGGAAAPPRR